MSLALTLASEDKPKNETIGQNRHSRQYGNYGEGNNNEVVVDIEDGEKTQYYETNYDTSKYLHARKMKSFLGPV